MDWITVLPNLSIGVVSVVALTYITIEHGKSARVQQDSFLSALDNRADRHEKSMNERENALRNVEKEVRTEISTHLTASTQTIKEASIVMERVLQRLTTK